eukprot:8674387-Pyramimonas_sp.AAC.1
MNKCGLRGHPCAMLEHCACRLMQPCSSFTSNVRPSYMSAIIWMYGSVKPHWSRTISSAEGSTRSNALDQL